MHKYSLNIPLMPSLDGLELSQVANALEEGGTRFSVESLNWPAKYPYRPLTVITAAHSGQYLYLDFLVRCNYLRAENYMPNTNVSEDSCVEFYVQPQPDGPYYTFEINCIGTLRGAICHPAGGDCSLLAPDDLARVKVYASVGTRPFCEVEGSFIWSIVAAIPLRLIGVEYNGQPIDMRGNFNKCASGTSQPHFLSWVPIHSPEPDFHAPDAFRPITLL